MTEDKVTVLDGTTGEMRTITRSYLEGIWSGYALVPDDHGLGSRWPFVAGLSLVCWLTLGLLSKRYLRRLPK